MSATSEPLLKSNSEPISQIYIPSLGKWLELTGERVENGGTKRYAMDVYPWGKTAGGLFAPLLIETTGALDVAVTGSLASVTTHHNAAVGAADGTDADVDGLHTLALDIDGTATSSTVLFQGSVDGTNFRSVMAVNLATNAIGTSTSGKDEMWQADVSGLKTFRARLDAVAGGNITVVSNAIA